jgi:hypothetical protein
MRQIRLKISDVLEIGPQSGDDAKDLAAITIYVLKHYAFLPKPIAVTLEGDEVVISFPEEPDANKEEARRLADTTQLHASLGSRRKTSISFSKEFLASIWITFLANAANSAVKSVSRTKA